MAKRKIRIPINGQLLHDLLKHTNQADIAKQFDISRQSLQGIYADDMIRPRMLIKLADQFEWDEKTVKALTQRDKQEMPRSMHIEFGY